MRQVSVQQRITLLVLWLLLITGGVARGDGIYIPPEAVEKLPAMPHQRGVIIWRDGVEQLLVESDFDGKGERMAWIVPVPNAPSNVEIGAPGVFDLFQKGLPPKTVRDAGLLRIVALLLLVWCACQLALGVYAPKKCMACTLAFFVVFFILFITTPWMFMTLGDSMGGEAGASEAVEVLAVNQVGSYEVTTLRATEAGALTIWLQEHGFQALPDGGEAIAAEYIAEGWCFIAAQLQRGADGYTRPHPLSITFPAETPVYPMRLTRLAETDLFLDLYVIADRRATAPTMDTVYCERFRREVASGVEIVRGSRYPNTAMGLPWLVSRMQDKDILTHLRAQVPAETMHQDIHIGFRSFARTRPRLELPEDRPVSRICYALSAFGLVFGIGLTWHYKYAVARQRRYVRTIALVVALLTATLASYIPAFTSTLGQHRSYDRYEGRRVDLAEAYKSLGGSPSVLEKMDAAAIEAFLLECLTYPKGEDANAGDFVGEGPGRFEIIEDERGTLLRTYGKSNNYYYRNLGNPLEYPLLNPDGKAAKSSIASMSGEPVLSIYPHSRLSFANVQPGDSKRLSIKLINRYGPVITGRVIAKKPYYVAEEDAAYTLRPMESKQIAIEFRPRRAGKYPGTVDFKGNDWRQVDVYGTSYEGRSIIDGITFDEEESWVGYIGRSARRERVQFNYIALRNDHDFPVDLEGWGMSNDPTAPFKHTFPKNTVIAPKDFIIVYLWEDALEAGRGYSVGFEVLKETQGYVGLCNPAGAVISKENYNVQDDDDDHSRGFRSFARRWRGRRR